MTNPVQLLDIMYLEYWREHRDDTLLPGECIRFPQEITKMADALGESEIRKAIDLRVHFVLFLEGRFYQYLIEKMQPNLSKNPKLYGSVINMQAQEVNSLFMLSAIKITRLFNVAVTCYTKAEITKNVKLKQIAYAIFDFTSQYCRADLRMLRECRIDDDLSQLIALKVLSAQRIVEEAAEENDSLKLQTCSELASRVSEEVIKIAQLPLDQVQADPHLENSAL